MVSIKPNTWKALAILPVFIFSFASRQTINSYPCWREQRRKWDRSVAKAFTRQTFLFILLKNCNCYMKTVLSICLDLTQRYAVTKQILYCSEQISIAFQQPSLVGLSSIDLAMVYKSPLTTDNTPPCYLLPISSFQLLSIFTICRSNWKSKVRIL